MKRQKLGSIYGAVSTAAGQNFGSKGVQSKTHHSPRQSHMYVSRILYRRGILSGSQPFPFTPQQ